MSFNLKKSIILGIATILLLIWCNAQASLTDGLAAYYPFDGDANDVSGNGNDATAYNDYEYIDGVFSNAICLVGSGHTGLNGGHVILPFIALNEFPAFTISMWVNHENSTSWGDESFISFGDCSQGDVIKIGYGCYFPDTHLSFGVGNGAVTIPYSSSLINNWNHLVLHCDNGMLTGFVNGQSVGSTTYELNDVRAIAGLGVHWFHSGGTESNRFIGIIDEVRIYDRALSDAEVLALATSKPVVTYPDGGEELLAGDTCNVSWVDIDSIDNVLIEYYSDNYDSWIVVDSNTPNDGEYDWIVPEITSKECLVRISDANDPNVFDVSDEVFAIFQCLGPVPGDLNDDCYVNGKDLAILAAHWLHCANPLDPACGIVAYWSFDDGTAMDNSGNGNDGTIYGATATDGISGQALDFDGSDYVGTSLTPSIYATASIWIHPEADVTGSFMGTGYTTDGGKDGWSWAYIGSGYHSVAIDFWKGNAKIGDGIDTPNGSIPLNQWSLITVVVNDTDISVYVNGEISTAGTILSSPSVHDRGLMIGRNFQFGGGANTMKGKIDEVRIYNRALTGTEIEYLYNAQ